MGISMVDENTAYVLGNYMYFDEANKFKSEILKTTDGGKTWEQIFFKDRYRLRSLSFKDQLNGVCAGDGGKVFKTNDGGNSWSERDLSSQSNIPYIYIADNNTIWAMDNRIYKNEPDNNLWIKMADEKNGGKIGFVNNEVGWYIASIWQNPYDYGAVYKTTNGGNTWDTSFDINKYIYDFSTYSDNKIAICGYGLIYVSNNSGNDWIKSNVPENEVYFYSIDFVNDSTLYCAAKNIYKSVDGGINWKKEPINYGNWIYGIKFTNDTSGLAVGDIGKIIKYGQPKVTNFQSNEDKFPNNYFLCQNFPNPFNPSTTIKYSIPKAENVTLKIYDVLGRQIKTLVNEKKPAGNYTVEYNGNNLPSGIYFYQIQAGNFIETKKMLLLK